MIVILLKKFQIVKILIIIIFMLAAKLGANAILGVSLAVCKAGAAHKVKFSFEICNITL